MYDKILQDDIHEDHRHLALRVLRWLAVSYRPLEIEEILEVCTIPPDSELEGATMLGQDRLTLQQILNLLPNLVMLDSSTDNSSLTFAHFSVREYLAGSQLLLPRDAHRLVAKDCLAYLYLSRGMKMKMDEKLQQYTNEHWQLHSVATGELDEDTRRNAFFLSASILTGDLATLYEDLPEDFVLTTQWLGDPKRIHGLISVLREFASRLPDPYSGHLPLPPDSLRLAMLYPQTGGDSMIRCSVHLVSLKYAPSYEGIYCPCSRSNCTQEIRLNDHSLCVPDDVHQVLQALRQGSTDIQLICLDFICTRQDDKWEESLKVFKSHWMYNPPKRMVVYLRETRDQRAVAHPQEHARCEELWLTDEDLLELRQELQLQSESNRPTLDELFANNAERLLQEISSFNQLSLTFADKGKQHRGTFLRALEEFLTAHKDEGLRMDFYLHSENLVFLCGSQKLSLEDFHAWLDPYEMIAKTPRNGRRYSSSGGALNY